MYNEYIILVMGHGCGTWKLNKSFEIKLKIYTKVDGKSNFNDHSKK